MLTDAELYLRGRLTLLASWEEYAHGAAGPPDWTEYDGENVATGMAFDLDGDFGIYNVGTLEHARRRGLGTALTAVLVHDALARGCQTASLQSTAIAEGVYAP